MTGQVEGLVQSGRGRCGCKDMGADTMKGAVLMMDLPLCCILPIR